MALPRLRMSSAASNSWPGVPQNVGARVTATRRLSSSMEYAGASAARWASCVPLRSSCGGFDIYDDPDYGVGVPPLTDEQFADPTDSAG